ncbi:MAG: adenylate/guanylate cyclase domain-containing protein [Deltaproteobacteria bacterium]|nr:adenylate/guanylate cyclase domain-containing protein [Deltaproteobacteria bacterium]
MRADPHLVLHSPDGLTAEFPIGARLSLGRHYENGVVVADREVSKRHAVVERTPEGHFLRDLGSSNGTFVNGRRIESLKLKDGDEVRLGTSKLVFRAGIAPVPAGPKVVQAPSVTQVLASVRPVAVTEAASFLPASQVTDLEALRKDYERLRVAYRFHQETGLVIDPSDLYERILELAFEILPAENGVLLVPDAEGYRVVRARSRTEGEEIQVSRTLLEGVAERGEGVLSTDAITDQRFKAAASMVTRGVRSVLAVPLVVHGTIRAIIYLDSRQISSFTAKDLDILSALAGQAAVSLLNAELIDKIKNEETTRSRLERFLSPALVQKAQAGELDLEKGGSLMRATILFSDIRGFTNLSENSEPEAVVGMLNAYFEEMVDAVFQHHGILDKFIGDAVMALWGVPVAGEDDASRAVRAALGMIERVRRLNEERAAEGLPAIEVGIGINTGECVVGNMGSSRRLEYTAIGDSVNLASRLCDLASGGEVLISEFTREALRGEFQCEALPAKQVKGKARPVPVFKVS